MAIPKITGAQRDFSAGELDVSMKRADDNPIMKAGVRQASNWRIKNSKSVVNRPGRTALYLASGRDEEVKMSPGNTFHLNFGENTITVFDSSGAQVFSQGSMPWTLATKGSIVWDIYQKSVYITYLNFIPKVLSWDGSTWTLTDYAEQTFASVQKRTFFYRISKLGVTMLPSGISGAITLTFSEGVMTPGRVGTRLRYVGRQVLITGYVSPTLVNADVEETLQGGRTLNFVVTPVDIFSVGDVVLGSFSGAKGIVAAVDGGAKTIDVALLNHTDFIWSATASVSDNVVGPAGSLQLSATPTIIDPLAIDVWDDEVMNALQGYPASCFVDQNRLGFCDFPSVPNGIGWSAIGNPLDLYVDATPANAIFELAPNKSRVLYAVAGPESSEFVFCDNGVYYIPITANNPLVPGSVAFNLISRDGCAPVQPRLVQELIVWINSGLTSVLAITAPGAYNRPYEARNLSELHAHLIKTPVAIAVPSTTSQFEERYAYVLNSDGTIAVGKYSIESGQIKGVVGWLPWSGAGTVNWLSAFQSDVIFSTSYAPNGIGAVSVIERLDNNQYLDGAVSVNSPPSALAPGFGQGPLWWLAGGTVDLIDNATRMMGTYTIDASGNIIPQGNAGEDLTSVQLVAGQAWTATLEPFVPDANPGQSVHQRMFKRRVSRMAVYVVNSTGFVMARLFSGPITPTSPPLGTIMNSHRVSTWNQGDDPTLPPPLREEAQRWRPLGRSFDPRVAIIKDTPGPLEIPELGLEATI